MSSTPQANRLTIAFFGRRNVGKSSLVNALTGQEVSLISNVPGSTADPIKKSMELHPIGPITVIDTAGLDDVGELGAQKVRRAKKILAEADLVVLVYDSSAQNHDWERRWLAQAPNLSGRLMLAANKIDLGSNDDSDPGGFKPETDAPLARVSTVTGQGLDELRQALTKLAAARPQEPPLVGDLIAPGAVVMLVAPQDKQAPKGRLILPQVQVIRDILDHHGIVVMAGTDEVEAQLAALAKTPDLVIVDAQVFGAVAAKLPPDTPLTAFSVIMARHKGDLAALAAGAMAMDGLKPDARVLIAEACTHHALKNDIAREQIPLALRKRVGAGVTIEAMAGHDFPDNLSSYDLIITCGSCMITRGEFMSRLDKAGKAGLPVTNFGLALAHFKGLLKRALAPFQAKA